MGVSRVRVAKDKAELVRALVEGKAKRSPFQTYADVLAFAAALGARRNKRVPLGTISHQEPAPISMEIFISRGYDRVIKLIAIMHTQDPNILSPFDAIAEAERVRIFEEFANGGLAILQDELRGAVDYTERLLLILGRERFQEQTTDEEFDLTRFL